MSRPYSYLFLTNKKTQVIHFNTNKMWATELFGTLTGHGKQSCENDGYYSKTGKETWKTRPTCLC